jgi:hypothetical protein
MVCSGSTLRGFEGHQVDVTLHDGRMIEDCRLVSGGRGRVRNLWLVVDGDDLFVPTDDVLALAACRESSVELDPPVDVETSARALLTTASSVRTAWRDRDLLAARRVSLCLTLLLLEHAEASGFAIWDPRQAVTAPRRAGHDAWLLAWSVVRGQDDVAGLQVDELLPLVALFLADEASAAA